MCDKCNRGSVFIDYAITDRSQQRNFCPNCLIYALAYGELTFVPDENLICQVSGNKGAVTLKSATDYMGIHESYTLRPDIMRRLINRGLYPAEYHSIVSAYKDATELPYLVHDDFYTEDGTAIQCVLDDTELKALYDKEVS